MVVGGEYTVDRPGRDSEAHEDGVAEPEGASCVETEPDTNTSLGVSQRGRLIVTLLNKGVSFSASGSGEETTRSSGAFSGLSCFTRSMFPLEMAIFGPKGIWEVLGLGEG